MIKPVANIIPLDTEAEGRREVLARFNSAEIMHLGRDDLLAAKALAGHGSEWGCWTNPKALIPGGRNYALEIDLRKRLLSFLTKEPIAATPQSVLVDEGVLTLTRIALLLKLVPTGGRGGKSAILKAPSIAHVLYGTWPKLIARSLRRKAEDPSVEGLFQCLTDTDVSEFRAITKTRAEIDRLHTLVARGVWLDAPPQPDIRQTTNPATRAAPPIFETKSEPFPPLPDEWLAEIGPRVLWVIEDMGPNLLRLLENLCEAFKGLDWAKTNIGRDVSKLITANLERHPWLDRSGKPLKPPFKLTTAHGKHGADTCEWPPCNWEHITVLSIVLQAAHLFMTLLLSGGRSGEIATLKQNCVEIGRDGKNYLSGYTYKLAANLFGDARTWPAPDILAQCLGHQARLAAAWNWLPSSYGEGLPQTPRFGDALWISIRVAGKFDKDLNLDINSALKNLARRLDMDPMPGGKNVHAHRFRKTIGRLAGVTLFNSPLVLKRIFGHKSIEMTLHYILCDPGVRKEAEMVLRELRIMHCAEALEEIHQAMRDGTALPDHGGPGAARLITAVRNEDVKLNQSGRVWSEGSAYDLSLLLTMQGQGWRLIQENIICSKVPGEDGLCRKMRSKGEPNTANCQPQCDNRIVFARKRRDVELSIEQYLDIARQARDDGQLLVLAASMDNAQDDWVSFPDLERKYRADPEVQALLALCDEPEGEVESA